MKKLISFNNLKEGLTLLYLDTYFNFKFNKTDVTVFPRVKNPKILELIIPFFHSGFNNNFL